VFCAFNNSYKITPPVFDCWMRILKQVPGSVLWLREKNPTTAENLKKEAEARGVDTARLIFAPRTESMADHLARHRLADLFLDNFPFGAQTTASDALWAGLPIVTRTGEAMMSRVAASLLTAVGLPELITTNEANYEALVLDLATHPDKLKDIRDKLARHRLTTPLFNTADYAAQFQAQLSKMVEASDQHRRA
jgi:predicted O-linked N-acetylglucosamine transferase (SPINDLY family)